MQVALLCLLDYCALVETWLELLATLFGFSLARTLSASLLRLLSHSTRMRPSSSEVLGKGLGPGQQKACAR